MKLKIYLICILTLSVFGCKHNTEDVAGDVNINIAGEINNAPVKSVINGTQFASGDRIGVYVVAWKNQSTIGALRESDNFRDNLPYSSDDAGVLSSDIPATSVYPNSNVKVDLCAVYPYSASGIKISNGKYQFVVNDDQSAQSSFIASDYMVAYSKEVVQSSSAVLLSFKHVMAKVSVLVTAPATYKGDAIVSVKSVKIVDVQKSALVDPTTVASTVHTTPVKGSVVMNSRGTDAGVSEFACIVAPNGASADYNLEIVISSSTKDYTFTYKGNAEIVAGNNYKVYITSFEDERILDLGAATIVNWNDGGKVNGGQLDEAGASESFKIDGVTATVTKVEVVCNDGYTYTLNATKESNTLKFAFAGNYTGAPEKYPYTITHVKFFDNTTASGGGELTAPVVVNARTSTVVNVTNSFK